MTEEIRYLPSTRILNIIKSLPKRDYILKELAEKFGCTPAHVSQLKPFLALHGIIVVRKCRNGVGNMTSKEYNAKYGRKCKDVEKLGLLY